MSVMTSHGPHPHHMTIRLLLLINSRHLHISFSAVYCNPSYHCARCYSDRFPVVRVIDKLLLVISPKVAGSSSLPVILSMLIFDDKLENWGRLDNRDSYLRIDESQYLPRLWWTPRYTVQRAHQAPEMRIFVLEWSSNLDWLRSCPTRQSVRVFLEEM